MLNRTIANGVQTGAKAGTRIEIMDELDLPGFKMTFGRDEEVYGEGETTDFVYKVISGVVRLHRLLEDGRRQISSFQFPGDIFGLELGEAHSDTAEAVSPCEIALVRRSVLERAISADPAAARRLWALTSAELRHAQTHLLLLGRKTAVERVGSFLMEMAGREKTSSGVKIPMSRTDIADYLGLTIETVSRTLSQLEREGAIALKGCREIALRNPLALAA